MNPAGFALLPGKSKEVYFKLYSEVRRVVGDYSPTHFILDMEPASAAAFLGVFGPEIVVIYCFFHLRQAFRSNLQVSSSLWPILLLFGFLLYLNIITLQEKGCLLEVTRSIHFNRLYRYCLGLVFVPVEDVFNLSMTILGPFVDQIEANLSEQVIYHSRWSSMTLICPRPWFGGHTSPGLMWAFTVPLLESEYCLVCLYVFF